MARTRKNHDERKTELLTLAEQLFLQKGYDNTTIKDIIDTAQIAKGTFYHYFTAKEDLLEGIAHLKFQPLIQAAKEIINDSTINSLEKLNSLFSAIQLWKTKNQKIYITTMKVLNRDENLIFRYKLLTHQFKALLPFYIKIIEEGKRTNLFYIDSPEITAGILNDLLAGLKNQIASKIFFLPDDPDEKQMLMIKKFFISRVTAYEKVIENVLGLPENSVILIERPYFQ
ncbi:MAG: TetR/AcrR family transcriptional regulator [Spirochaetes bacterium]|nr:TetR/AcrR family transcriptional regulator [Spirochaetota bacterium]